MSVWRLMGTDCLRQEEYETHTIEDLIIKLILLSLPFQPTQTMLSCFVQRHN